MRDDTSRVGRPRKGTQKKPKDRTERYKPSTAQSTYMFSNEEDFQVPSDARNSKRAGSPLNMLSDEYAATIDSMSPDLSQFEENDSGIASQDTLCAFCNCGSEMAQILGQINRYFPSPDFDPFSYEEHTGAGYSMDPSAEHYRERSRDGSESGRPINYLLKPEKRSVGRPPGKKKKRRRQPTARLQHLTADMSTFGTATRPETADVFDADGCIWAHHCCAAWSAGVCQTDSYDLENVDKAAYKAIAEQCSHCNRHGASVECQIQKCTKLYHYPCCASGGAFQDIKSMILLCPDHLDHAAGLADSEACCVLCDKAGDISKQLFCTSCGRHYHGQCLDPPVSISAIVRMGWQCPECKVCQGCRQPGDDEKMLFCDECDKGFHTYCLSPPMSSVPKTAWKCYSCRKCEDCGSNVPGSGPSCRWHFNYTVCDKCYQQRKKGTMPCCPMCGKAVRSASGEFSKQCIKCCRLVHCRCDKVAAAEGMDYFCSNCRHDNHDEDDSEMASFMDHKEESNDSLLLNPVHSSTSELDPEYLGQRTVTIAEAEAISRTATGFMQREPSPLLEQNEIEDLDLKGMDINFDEVMMETGLHGPLIQDLEDLKPESSDSLNSPPHISSSAPYMNQFTSSEEKEATRLTTSAPGKAGRGKKKMPPLRCRGRPPGTAAKGKKNKGQRGGRPRSKSASTSGSNKENIQAGIVNSAETSRKDDSDDPEGLHSTVVMVSTKDRFTLEQDICMCCGSFGKGSEGQLITCAQCGQCFHPYCVNLKVNKVVMTKGWRCLDCTVCEGCGKNEDEGKLLLCDGCDISYHIYCLDPPLEEVPSDGWKCQWCVECLNCGTTNPGVGCKWMSSYSQCGPCASDTSCPVCNKTYLDDELVVKCMHCARWLHAECDGLASEDDAELAASYVYHCCLCREQTGHYGIFSTSWTNIVERGVYSSDNGKFTTLQSVVVTQTTTTVMATGVANRRTKSGSKSNRHPLTASGWNQRQPKTPVQASAQGTFEVQLPGLKLKGRRDEFADGETISLTDNGIRQIKSLVVKASSRSHGRNKDKQGKVASIDDRANERETKTSGQLTETSTCSEDIGENRQPVCLASDSGNLHGNETDADAANRKTEKEKRGPGRPPAEKQTDQNRAKKMNEKRDDPLDFFGPGLLKLSKKKRKKDSIIENDTQSSDDDRSKKEKLKTSSQITEESSYLISKVKHADQSTPSFRSQAGSWPSTMSSGMKMDHLTEDTQHPDSLYKTLNMLVSGVEHGERGSTQREQSLGQQKTQQNFGTLKAPLGRHASKGGVSEHTNGMDQNPDIAQTGDLDIIGLSDLPHVDGHEVEQIFAGIEREMSVDGTPQSHGQSPMEATISEYSSTGNNDKAKQVESPRTFQGQNRLGSVAPQRPESVLASGYPDQHQQQQIALSQQDFRQYDLYCSNPSFPLEHNIDYKANQKPVQSQSGETDAFKAVFGEEPEIKSKSREGTASPKIDGQKQLKKWEQDEKLENLATISPVLYANIVHPNLKIEYPEWPNRARAIARLWRKLPQEQREPFRLRARDNRVKQKDQGRKLGPFQKTSTPTSSEGIPQNFDSSSNLSSSEVAGSGSLNANTEAAAVKVLSSNMMLNGERAAASLASSRPYTQASQPRFAHGNVPLPLSTRPSNENRTPLNFPHHSTSTLVSSEHHQPGSASIPNPVITSPQSHFPSSQSSTGVIARPMLKGSNKPQPFLELSPAEMQYTRTGLTPTTPIFASSPFQNTPLGSDVSGSPVLMSPSLPVEQATGEKRKMKKPPRMSKEQSESEKEEKKRKLALEQEKERQWKILQQQRLKEQQSHQQTSTIQQVMMMKEQMRKENNKPSRKSLLMFAPENDHALNDFSSNVLPTVKPLTVAQTSKQRGIGSPATTVATSSHLVNDGEYPTEHPSSHNSFLVNNMIGKDSAGHQYGFDNLRNEQATELDSLLEINATDLVSIGSSKSVQNDAESASSAGIPPAYASIESTAMQTDNASEAQVAFSSPKTQIDFLNEKNDLAGSVSVAQHHQTLGITLTNTSASSNTQSVIFSAVSSQSDSKPQAASDSQLTKAISGFLLDTNSSIAQTGVNETTGLRPQQQQQQAIMFQQQQFMAAQQQYIQWQLQQRNPELFQSITAPVQYSSYTDKDLPEVDSEEQHQERIRFLYRQRQMQKQQVVQLQQQIHHQQIYAQQQVTPGSTGATTRPQMDQTQQQFVQQLMQYQQQIPEALQQQFLLEYSRQMQQRTDLSQNTLQYDKFLSELAQQYGYPMQQANAQTVSVMPHNISWPNASVANFHPNMQQMFTYGAIDEEKAKELTPQQLYQLQMQHTLMMQMVASGLYPAQPAAVRNQSPATSASRKSSTNSSQTKKSREPKKAAMQEKSVKLDPDLPAKHDLKSMASPLPHGKVADDADQKEVHETPAGQSENEKSSANTSGANTVTGKSASSVSEIAQSHTPVSGMYQAQTSLALSSDISDSTASQGMISRENANNDDVKSSVQDTRVQNDKATAANNQDLTHQKYNNEIKDVELSPERTKTSSPSALEKDLATTGPVNPAQNTSVVTSNSEEKTVCSDGIHCGTDSESEDAPCSNNTSNTLSNNTVKQNEILHEKQGKKAVCDDGIHCGTDSEDESHLPGATTKDKEPCADGIHCGTDTEDDEFVGKSTGTNYKQPCTDGIHCGTDSEEEDEKPKVFNRVTKSGTTNCTDGIHCGTDSEDESNTGVLKRNTLGPELPSNLRLKESLSADRSTNRCSDGVHCGTDSEGEDDSRDSNTAKLPFEAGKKETTVQREGKAGIIMNKESKDVAKVSHPRPLVVVCRQETTVTLVHPRNTSIFHPSSLPTSSSVVTRAITSNHTVEVIQEGDVTQNTFNALESMSRNLKGSKLVNSVQDGYSIPSLVASSGNVAPVSSQPPLSKIKTPVTSGSPYELTNVTNLQQKQCVVSKPLSRNSSPSQRTADDNTKTHFLTTISTSSLTFPTASTKVEMQSTSDKTVSIAVGSVSQAQITGSLKTLPQISDSKASTQPTLQQATQSQPFSPNNTPQTPNLEQQVNPRQKQKITGIPPTSPQYQQLFMHQHQLLIMQFQQYQFQLQAQYQQLSQQQMSPQQQFLLQQQYHQQMMVLQRQFVQQQAQLQSMASTGMQFSEQELNLMYQQQMVAQQAYKQWVATLSLDQQGQLHARMQANMQQVQQGMASVMQNALKNASENSREKPKKQRGRRPRKSKTDATDPATPAPNTPTQPPTPSSVVDAAQSSAPSKDAEVDPRKKVIRSQLQDASKIIQNQAGQIGLAPGQPASMHGPTQLNLYSNMPHDQTKPVLPTSGDQLHSQASYVSASFDQRIPVVSRQDWQQAQLQSIQQQQQQQQQQQTVKQVAQTTLQNQRQQPPRVDIVPEGSNPFSDVYQEIERKGRVLNRLPTTPIDQFTRSNIQGGQSNVVDPWKNVQPSQPPNSQPESVNQRLVQTPVNSTSTLYYPNNSLRISQEIDYFSQNKRQTPVQQPMPSPNFTQNQNTVLSIHNTHYNITTVITQPSTAIVESTPQLVTVKSAPLQMPAENVQHQQWVQSTSGSSDHRPQPQQVHAAELHKQSNLAYQSPIERPITETVNHPPPPFSRQGSNSSTTQNDHLTSQNSAVRSPLHYSTGYTQQQQPINITTHTNDPNATPLNAVGDAKENTKSLQKRKKGGQGSQITSGNVDFSLLNPEEQRTFILERKREDFERRRRLLEEQRQLKLRDQGNQRPGSKKVEKKLPRAKQPRKLKGMAREKEPVPAKSPVPARLILEDKGLRLPLCEPEVHLLYPLVQPFGSGYLNGDKMILGEFGSATLQDNIDYYAQFPSPNPPVTSSNPPTPPASLPPSPGTINQSLRDSLQMIPTGGIFDDLSQKPDSDKTATLYRQEVSQQGNSRAPFSPAANRPKQNEDQIRKDSKEGVLVTLTMARNDHRLPDERVTLVTNILGVPKPQTIEIADENPDNANESQNESNQPRPTATSIGNESDVYFSCLDKRKPKSDEENKAPFCKHCDILIHGSGYVKCIDDSTLSKDSIVVTIDNSKYTKIDIAAGDDFSFVFCSQMCLKSYHSLSKSKMVSNAINGADADDSGRFIDPVRSVIPVSTGEASNAGYLRSTIDSYEIRGELQAAAPLPGLVKRKNIGMDDELDKKKHRPVIWKRWKIVFTSKSMKKDSMKLTATQLLEKYGAALKTGIDARDDRECMLCGDIGDGITEGTARLINYDVNIWVHLNCALWSLEVYETLNGALHNVQKAYERGIQTICVYCYKKGATVTCARVIGSQMRRCEMNYHFNCAIKANCVFFKDKTILCPQHRNYGSVDQRLPSYAVLRKVYINRDITKQLTRVLKFNNEKEQRAFTIRIGSLIFHDLGQLLPHQLQKFHSKDAIYPIGFKTTRFYWSTEEIGKRCSYICSVEELDGLPHFLVTIENIGKKIGQFAGSSPKEVWSCIFEPVRKLREEAKMVKIFPEFVTGEDLFGLSDPSIQRIIESLPGVDTIHDYSFRFGRTPIIMAELPLAVNPTGCMRSESTRNVHLNRPVSLRTASSAPPERVERGDSFVEDNSQGSMLRNWAISKTAQYRRMKSEWTNYVLLSRSRIQGLGLFAIRDIESNTMIIEYIGSIIRNEVANKRERIYENSNRGVYMFRVDTDTVIDATLTGGPARYINHSCDPNCVAEVVIIEKMPKIIIISNRKLEKGEELTYDYKFEFEDDQHKIACLCGAANCRKWMN